MIQRVVVLGAGSAGLIAALTLKKRMPALDLSIVYDPSIGVIGVGEGSTPNFVSHLFDFIGVDMQRFYDKAQPTWKLGIKFKWGPYEEFNYAFDGRFDVLFKNMKYPMGFFCMNGAENQNNSICSALMEVDKVFPRHHDGMPLIEGVRGGYSFHVENEKLVEMLEAECREAGVVFTPGKMVGADQGPGGVEVLHLEGGAKVEADLYIDASGFRAELIGGVMEEPFVSFDHTLFCDRAVVGGWERAGEPILPYTTAEQMDAGWSWQIEHEHFINRGYVFSSAMTSDDEAVEEFRRKNPKLPESPRVVPFVSGYRKRSWVKNVFAIGNAAGFVEPLEATALMVICNQCNGLALTLQQSMCEVSPSAQALYNRLQDTEWCLIRDFLGLHYKFNTAMDTPFWRRCQQETDLSGIQAVLDFYEENGPTAQISHLLPTYNDFGVHGFLLMLVYNQAPCKKKVEITTPELQAWNKICSDNRFQAALGVDVKETLDISRSDRWKWS